MKLINSRIINIFRRKLKLNIHLQLHIFDLFSYQNPGSITTRHPIHILECKLERRRLAISFQVASLLEKREKFRWNRNAFIPPIHDSYHDRIDESFQPGLGI